MIETKIETFTLPPLPYEQNALEPYISGKTVSLHYGKHHQGYVSKLNELVLGTEFAELKLEEIIAKTSVGRNQETLFNNAAQVWNHNFYWNSLTPEGGKKPTGELERNIEISFGSYENLIQKFAETGMSQFGSGWVWLVKEDGKLRIFQTPDAENPISERRGTALLALDVWEHAYYLDYENRRNDYLARVLDKLINWNFAAENFSRK